MISVFNQLKWLPMQSISERSLKMALECMCVPCDCCICTEIWEYYSTQQDCQTGSIFNDSACNCNVNDRDKTISGIDSLKVSVK